MELILSQTQTEPELTDGQVIQDVDLESEQVSGGGTIPPDSDSMDTLPRPGRGRSRSRSSSPLSQNLLAVSSHRNMEEMGRNDGLTLHVPSRSVSPSRRTENFDQLRDKFAKMKK